MTGWEILGIPQTDDIAAIKKAYAEKSKLYHPETHPEEFKQLHSAYKRILSSLKKPKATPIIVPTASRRIPKPVAPKKPEAPVRIPSRPATVLTVIPYKPETVKSEPAETVIEASNTQKEPTLTSFMEQVEELAKNQHPDLHNDPMIRKLITLLHDEKEMYYHKTWQKYFVSAAFLERQYQPDFINEMTRALKKFAEENFRNGNRLSGRFPTVFVEYLLIAYGCMFDHIGLVETKEKVYKKALLTELRYMLSTYHDNLFYDYLHLEERDELLGDRFAFYVYRNILELLECENPNKLKLRRWLTDAFDRTNITHVGKLLHYEPIEGSGKWVGKLYRNKNRIITSPIIYELVAYLLSCNHVHSQLMEDMVENVCKQYVHSKDYRDERDVLLLLIRENREKRKEP